MLRSIVFWGLTSIYACAQGATFSTHCDGSFEEVTRGCSIVLRGPIVAGDVNRLVTALRQPLPSGRWYETLVLDSPGGRVSEALDLAGIVVDAMLETSTLRWGPQNADARERPAHSKCASACVLVWAAGARRKAFEGSIGLHRPVLPREAYSEPPASVAKLQSDANTQVSEGGLKSEVQHPPA